MCPKRQVPVTGDAGSVLEAEAELTALARELDRTHSSAAASLREGLAETLTVLRLGISTDAGPHAALDQRGRALIGICRDHSSNVKNWRDGQMALR